MFTALFDHIQKFITLEPSEIETLEACLTISKVKKKEHLLQEGQVCNTLYFILKGCARQYIINPKGVEQTLQFAVENWWITDYLSYHNSTPSHFYIQTVENCELIAIEKGTLEFLLIEIPKLERYLELFLKNHLARPKCVLNFYSQCLPKKGIIILIIKIRSLYSVYHNTCLPPI